MDDQAAPDDGGVAAWRRGGVAARSGMGVDRMVAWLSRNWVVGAGFMAAAGIATAPILAVSVSRAVLLVLLCSPVYMVHQVEEHRRDRFRRFLNDRVFAGRRAMTRRDVLIVNVPVVWGMNAAAAYAAVFVAPAAGLVAGYAMLVNALGHVAAAVRMRAYNPGLLSAVVLFVPLGLAVVVVTGSSSSGAPPVHLAAHLIALGGALALHGAIAVHALRRAASDAARMRKTGVEAACEGPVKFPAM